MTVELKRYTPIETPDGLFGNVDMIESPHGEYVRFADIDACTQAAIAAAMMGAMLWNPQSILPDTDLPGDVNKLITDTN